MIVMGSTTTPIMSEPLLMATAYQMYLRTESVQLVETQDTSDGGTCPTRADGT